MNNCFRLIAAAVAAPLALAGCATHYACPMPQGDGGCRSVDQVYEDTLSDTGTKTPSAGSAKNAKSDAATHITVSAAAAPSLQPAGPGAALLTTPRVLRVYLSPWQDSDGDLQGGGYLYLRLDRGQWTISPKQ